MRSTLIAGAAFAAGTLAQSNDTASRIAASITRLYNNGSESGPQVPGLFPEDDYYFWESGLAWDTMINYWAHSGDETLVPTVQAALLHQRGQDDAYLPANQTRNLGNEDQTFWGLAAMSAAELGFPAAESTNVTWFDLAKNVFDTQVQRWNEATCNGGLRWQIFTFNAGYNYKNSLTQANFALLGARLYRYSGNETYLEWAERAVEWSVNAGLIYSPREGVPAIYDGTDVTTNCSDVNHIQWTINAGQFMNAYAYACNGTCSSTWQELGRVALASTTGVFARNGSILTEVACRPSGTCNTDQEAYRAPLARGLANARDMVSDLDDSSKEDANKIIAASARGAGIQCAGTEGCGTDWSAKEFDGATGLGQDLAGLEIIMATSTRPQLRTANGTTGGAAGGSAGGSGNGTSPTGGSSGPAEADANGAAGFTYSLLFVAIPASIVGLVSVL